MKGESWMENNYNNIILKNFNATFLYSENNIEVYDLKPKQ
jgi:hypothetical protein